LISSSGFQLILAGNQLRVADLVSSQQRKEKLSEKLLTLLGYHLQLNFLNSRSVPSSKD